MIPRPQICEMTMTKESNKTLLFNEQSITAARFTALPKELDCSIHYDVVNDLLTRYKRKKKPEVIAGTIAHICDEVPIRTFPKQLHPALNMQVNSAKSIYRSLIATSGYFYGEAPFNDLVFEVIVDLSEFREKSGPSSKTIIDLLLREQLSQKEISEKTLIPTGNVCRVVKKLKALQENIKATLNIIDAMQNGAEQLTI